MTWKKEIKSEIIDQAYDLGYFTLQEFYRSSLKNLQMKYPKNNTCEASIRRILQELRDDGYLEFVSPSKYRVISEENNEWIQFIENYHKK
jgi:hypothetical protein